MFLLRKAQKSGSSEFLVVGSSLVVSFTTEGAEINGSERNRTDLPTVQTMRPIIRRFRHSLPWALKSLSLAMAKPSKSAAPRLKEYERKACGKRRCLLRDSAKRKRPSVRFRSHSFARSVADLGFSPDGNWSSLEAQEGEWARNRIIGHGFRTGARTGWLIPLFPFFSVLSVVKNLLEGLNSQGKPQRT